MIPKVSIIILNWNGLKDTIECLESLKKIIYPKYGIIVVDNGSKGNDADTIEKKYPGYVKLIRNDKNYGFAEGNNIAIRWALKNTKPDYFLLLNNDTVVDPGFLKELINAAETDDNIGMVGPKVYYYDEPHKISFAGGKVNLFKGVSYHLGDGCISENKYNEKIEVDYIEGSCLLVKKKVIDTIGILSSEYFAYWEETDWCFRARENGYHLLCVPSAKIWHKISASLRGDTNYFRSYYMLRNRLFFMKSHASFIQKLTFIPFLLKDLLFTAASPLIKKRDIKKFLKIININTKAVWDGLHRNTISNYNLML